MQRFEKGEQIIFDWYTHCKDSLFNEDDDTGSEPKGDTLASCSQMISAEGQILVDNLEYLKDELY